MPVVLSTWKEIAAHLGKGVRTVQRWERELDFPIHRPIRGKKHIVIAYPEELEQWVRGRRLPSAQKINGIDMQNTKILVKEIGEQTRILREQMARLLQAHGRKRIG